jgi:hypothetical protein
MRLTVPVAADSGRRASAAGGRRPLPRASVRASAAARLAVAVGEWALSPFARGDSSPSESLPVLLPGPGTSLALPLPPEAKQIDEDGKDDDDEQLHRACNAYAGPPEHHGAIPNHHLMDLTTAVD